MTKKNINLIIGVGLAVLAIILLNMYMSAEKEKVADNLKKAISQEYENLTSIMVAKEDIAPGTVVTPDMLRTEVVPEQYIQPQAVTSLDRIAGMRAAVPIKKGEQITLSKLLTSRQAFRSLAMATPVGKRAITVNVDSPLTSMIVPGDYVDVIAVTGLPAQGADGSMIMQMATIPLFQNVLVLAVNKDLNIASEEDKEALLEKFSRKDKEESKREGSSLVTFALTPQEASLLSFVREQGKIQVILRSPADANVQPLSPANFQTLIQHLNSLMPVQPQMPQMPTIEPPTAKRKIEIYRGSEKGDASIAE